MADNTKPQLNAGEKQVVNLLEEQLPADMLKGMPSEMNSWIKGMIGTAAQAVSGMVGQQVANLFVFFGNAAGAKPETLSTLSKVGDRVGRGVITMASDLIPAYRIAQNHFKTGKTIAQDFGLATRAEGKSGNLFSTSSELEVVKHLRDVNAKSTILQTQGWAKGFVTRAVPTIALNEWSIATDNLKKYNEYQRLKKSNPSSSIVQKYEKDKLFTQKVKSAEYFDGLLDKHGGSWIPTNNGDYSESLLSSLILGSNTDTTKYEKKDGEGRVAFVKSLGERISWGFQFIAPKLISSFARDNHTPQAKALLEKPSAGTMILKLQDFLKDNPSPLRVTIGNKSATLEEYVYEVFKQHREDMGRKPLTASATDELRDACAMIADAMVDPHRQLHAQALVHLVDGQVGIVKQNAVLNGDALSDKIQTLVERGLSSRKKLKSGEKASEQLNFSKEEFFASWENLSPDEKMVWSTFFSDEVMKEYGVKPEEIKQYRRRGNELVMEVMEEVFKSVEKLSARELHEMGLDVKTARQVAKFTEGMRRDPHNFIAERRKEAMELTAEIGVKLAQEQDEEKPKFLSRILEKAASRKLGGEDIWEEEKPKATSFRDKVKGERAPTDELEEALPEERSFSSRERKNGSHRDRHHRNLHEQAEGGRHA